MATLHIKAIGIAFMRAWWIWSLMSFCTCHQWITFNTWFVPISLPGLVPYSLDTKTWLLSIPWTGKMEVRETQPLKEELSMDPELKSFLRASITRGMLSTVVSPRSPISLTYLVEHRISGDEFHGE